jgi:hypothetical protein
MSRLQDKQCSLLKKKCLVEGCAQYDERLDACSWNLLTFNMYKVANAIEKATPGAMPQNQPAQGSFPAPQYRPG